MTYYSRRQLEALGEPLGDSVTRKEGGRIIYGGGGSGGGGSPAPTTNTTYSTNVPEYARPYVENMLESTQKQIYTDDMAGFRPYKPYSTDPNKYFAGFQPLQEKAMTATGNLQTPGQYTTATGLAGMSGIEGLGLAGQMAGAGGRYAQQATDPTAIQSYMSPYMQNVVDYQKSQALRDYQMAAPMRARAAVGAGAFGGSRQAIESAEAQRNLMSQLQGIEAQGRQGAFQQAQQAQQFGANLGLQGQQGALGGLGAATQAAGALGQLGGQQLGAQKEIIGLQSQLGKEQQAFEQNKINQQIQDYAIAQQYPFMQLGMMNAMLRGLPMQTQTTQLYQAQPSTLQQGIGLAGAASTLFGGRAAGGAIKEYREGGIIGYAPGGVIDSTRADLEQIADMPGGMQKLEEIRNSSSSKEVRKMAGEIIVQKQMEAQAEQQAQKARMSGIALAGGPAFESQNMAGGGIIAFAGDGPSLVEDPQFGGADLNMDRARLDQIQMQKDVEKYEFLKDASPVAAKRMLDENPMLRAKVAPPTPPAPAAAAAAPKPETKPEGGAPVDRGIAALTGRKSLEQEMREQERLMGPNTVNEGLNAKIAERLANLSKQEKQDDLAALRKAFIKFGTEASPGGMGVAALKGIESYGDARDAAKKVREGIDLELTKMQADIKKGERAERRGNLDAAAKSYENVENRQLKIAEMQNQLKIAGMQLNRPGEFEKAFALFQKDPVAFEQFIAAKDTNRGNLAAATKNILQAKYPEYAMTAMIPPEKRTKQQNEYLQNAYRDAEATARDMMRRGPSSTGSKASGEVDTKNPLLGP